MLVGKKIWKRKLLCTTLYAPAVFIQQLIYIHQNQAKAGLCEYL